MDNKLQTITIKNKDGQDIELTIYLTYHNEALDKNYIIFYEKDNPDNLIAAEYDEEGYLSDIESDEEYDELDRIIAEHQEKNQN